MTTIEPATHIPARAWVAAFLRRDWKIARSYRLQFVLELGSIPLALGVFLFVSRLVDPGRLPSDDDLQQGYFAFVAVGLTAIRMVQVAFTSFCTKIRDEQTGGTFEALLSSPVSPSVIVVGSATFDVVRAVVTGLVTLAMAAAFGVRFQLGAGSVPGLLLGMPALIATFAAVGILLAAGAVIFKQVTALVGLGTAALALLAGVYFPVSYLPQPLEAVANVLPFTWGIDVLRAALLRGQLAAGRLALLLGFAALSLPVSLWIFRVAVDRARRRGTVIQF